MAQGPKIISLEAIPGISQLAPVSVTGKIKESDRVAGPVDVPGNVVSRNSPILVQRDPNGQRDGMFVEAAELATDGTSEGNRKIDSGEIRIYRAPVRPKNAPSTARLAPPAETREREAAVSEPETAPPAPAPTPPAGAIAVAAGHGPGYEWVAPPVTRKPPKTKVQMSGAGMARVTVYFAEVHISPTLIVLGFADDGESAVIEPPAAGADNPLTLVIAGKTYTCMSGEFSFTRDGMTFLVLILGEAAG